MELIKIDRPIEENMDYTLTDEECDSLFSSIKESLNSECSLNSKSAINEIEVETIAGIAGGVTLVSVLIAKIIKWIKNKYRLTVSKLLDQSKELNDIYTKVNDLLKNDKMARFRHRNDRLDYEWHYIILKNSKDLKDYNIVVDLTAYNPEYFVYKINDIIKIANQYPEEKRSAAIDSMKTSLIQQINDSFAEKHGYVDDCEPLMKIVSYKNEKLEKILTNYKTVIGNIYNMLYIFNKYVEEELKYMQFVQNAYDKMLSTYGKNKDYRNLIDGVFKELLKNATKSMDFNSKSMVILTEMIHYYVEQLTKLYDHIRS